jgi:hypothetical protein
MLGAVARRHNDTSTTLETTRDDYGVLFDARLLPAPGGCTRLHGTIESLTAA